MPGRDSLTTIKIKSPGDKEDHLASKINPIKMPPKTHRKKIQKKFRKKTPKNNFW
jgi:hypothetical protein